MKYNFIQDIQDKVLQLLLARNLNVVLYLVLILLYLIDIF